MEKPQLLEKLIEILKDDHFIGRNESVTLESRFDELVLDEADIWDLTGYFETELGIVIPDEKIAHFEKVGDLVDAAHEQILDKPQAGYATIDLVIVTLAIIGLGALLAGLLLRH